MSPGCSTANEKRNSKLLYSMSQGQQKIYNCFATEVINVQGIFLKTNGEEVVVTITDKMQGCQLGIPSTRCTMNQEVECGSREYYGLSGWCALMEMVRDRVVAWWPSTLPPKTALTHFSPHQQAQRRLVCGSLLSCCSLLLPGSLCGISISSFNRNPETWGDNVSCLFPP